MGRLVLLYDFAWLESKARVKDHKSWTTGVSLSKSEVFCGAITLLVFRISISRREAKDKEHGTRKGQNLLPAFTYDYRKYLHEMGLSGRF